MHCQELHLDSFKGDFLNIFAQSDSRFSISAKYCPNKPYINGKIIFSAFRLCINLKFTKLTLMIGFVIHVYNL